MDKRAPKTRYDAGVILAFRTRETRAPHSAFC